MSPCPRPLRRAFFDYLSSEVRVRGGVRYGDRTHIDEGGGPVNMKTANAITNRVVVMPFAGPTSEAVPLI